MRNFSTRQYLKNLVFLLFYFLFDLGIIKINEKFFYKAIFKKLLQMKVESVLTF
ncbi:hypothetical protein NUSPORA_00300 [Nucleospora cyclopteri]